MYFLYTFLIAILAATTAAQPKPCRVPLIAFNSFEYEFTINVQNAAQGFHKTPVYFVKDDKTGVYRSLVGSTDGGSGPVLTKLKLTENYLYLQGAGRGYVGIEQSGYLRFSATGGNRLWMIAHYGCDESGAQQIVLDRSTRLNLPHL